MKKIIILSISVLCFLSVASDLQKKYVKEGEYDIECYVSPKQVKSYSKHKEYYWFKAGGIHHSVSESAGMVLHDSYKKFYRSKQLAESGSFRYGLKVGVWKEWYENGQLKSYVKWNNGFKQGKYFLYEQSGALQQSGHYRRNKKSGYWINHKEQDTVFYKKDSMYQQKPKSKVGLLLGKIFKKRDSLEKAQRKLKRQTKKKQDSIERTMKKAKK